jgi:hypothetical protein
MISICSRVFVATLLAMVVAGSSWNIFVSYEKCGEMLPIVWARLEYFESLQEM